uniref:Uncharacterized protein n=1 Tax=viral metagenome TaxID=1070528 RepID=A0A6C0CSV7_9ZZZZ
MSTFLISRNNLSDLTNIEKARNNLGIGTLALQNADDVNITGGSISVHSLSLNKAGAESNSFVVSLDEEGTLGYYTPTIRDWLDKPQNEVNISEFNNDLNFVQVDDLANVAFTGDFNDLLNVPFDLSELFDESDFLLKKHNLADLDNIEEAKANLGFGPFASFSSTDTIILSNLYILNDFHFIPTRTNLDQYLNKYLQITQYNEADNTMKTEWVDFPIAGQNGNTFGLLQLSSDYQSDDPYTAPTSKALFDAYYDLYGRIANTTEQQFMNDLIDNYGLLTRSKNLQEFASHIPEVKSNLLLGTLSEQNADNVTIANLEITEQFKFSKLPYAGSFLGCRNSKGEAIWQNLPMANPILETEGMVYIASDITNVPSYRISQTVPNVQALEDIYDGLLLDIETLSNQVPTKVRDLEDWTQFCLIDDAFLHINADQAKTNLKLSPVAWTASYTSLINTPTNLSDFYNDVFLEKNNNLNDLTDKEQALNNLGFGDMCKQDSNNVNITGGNATLNNLTITDNFVFQNIPDDNDTDFQTYFLGADNRGGKVTWRKIQNATEELHGVVQLTHDISIQQNLSKIASATAVFKVFTELDAKIQLISSRVERLLSRVS